MTKTEKAFVKFLASTKSEKWKLENGALRIGGRGPVGEHCPLTAVAHKYTANSYSVADYKQAADTLSVHNESLHDLVKSDASDLIVYAADHDLVMIWECGDRRVKVKHLVDLRIAMLKAVGLHEDAKAELKVLEVFKRGRPIWR